MASPIYIIMLKILIYRLKLKLPRHKILLSLTISDCIQIVVNAILRFSVYSATVSSIGCQIIRKILQFTSILTVISSSGSILMLSFERYVACIHCLRLHAIITDKVVDRGLCCIWVISILCGFLEKTRYEVCLGPVVLTHLKTDSIIYTIVVLSSSVLLAAVQIRLYLLSYTKTKIHPSGNVFGRKAEENDLRKNQIKLTIVASAIVLLYVVCMCPLAFYLISIGFESKNPDSMFRILSIMLVVINALMDPFVYGFGMADTRKAIITELQGIKSFFLNLLPTTSES